MISVTKKSIKSDLARLDRMKDEDIDYSDIPELGDEFFSRAVHPQQPPDPWLRAMTDDELPEFYEIKEAVAHPDHTVTVTWLDGARAEVSFAPFLEKGGAFEALKDPNYFVREMRVLRGGIGLTWPNEVDFSADGLRQDAFPADPRRGWVSWPPLADEESVFALLLEIVCRHCGTTGDDLDSHGIPAHADLMRLCAEDGYIEITSERDGRIFAVVTPEGRALLDWLRADRERWPKPMIDWTNCPDVQTVTGRCGGAWVVKDSRVIVQSCILDNAVAGCSAEEIADMFELPDVDVVRRILAFARRP